MIKHLKENWIKTFFLSGVYFFAISLLFTENYRNTTLFIFAVSTLINFIIIRKKETKNYKKIILFNTLFFITMLVSLIYSKNIDYGLKRVTAMVALIIIPLAFYTFHKNFNLNYKKVSLRVYLLFFCSSIVFLIGVAVHNYINGHFNEFIFRDYPERLNTYYGKYSMHPIYMSLYLSVSLVFSIPIFKSLTKSIHKVLLIIGALLMTTILLVLARKGIIVVTFLVFFFYLLKNKKQKSLVYYGIITLVFLGIAYSIPEIRNRFLEFISTFVNSNIPKKGSTSIRLEVYKCVVSTIYQNPILGYGIGDVKTALISCYDENYNMFKGKFFNAHNQYLSGWLSAGILGILSLLSLAIFNFKLAIKKQDFVHIAILALFFTTLLTENVLERQNGVMLFSFFLNFFAFKNLQSESEN